MLISMLAIAACSDKEASPEQQIRQLIANGVRHAEGRDAGSLRKLIADDYQDEKNLDKNGIIRLAVGYFLGHKNIRLFTQIKDIHFKEPNQAHVRVFVAMTGKHIEMADSLLNLHAQLYLFELGLIRDDDEWLLQRARWRRAEISEILNEQ